ncbi:SIMPL domain-containing protein [Nocardioides sp. AE5]|uniref:SIMPL domain-containing protein n=1 Tax=Nocardioides sp. AE5 TaxID=2962573 RepID=UPI0028829EE6|nr:SIMPL domain-containing protein [Nocardioides sp. AE5]MDT0201321.1 SIMPL domain-containing protein [Nocardioides sp. AE5]
MASTQFTVRGEAARRTPPQQATVRLTIASEDDQPGVAHDAVARSLEQVVATITALHDPEAGPVTWFSQAQLRTWSNRPWHPEGERLPPVHHASVPLQVRFIDFVALGQWISGVIDVPCVAVDGVDWALAEQDEKSLEAEVRADAVRDALARAQGYADALALGAVRPIHLADAGMLDGQGRDGHQPMAFAARAAMPSDSPDFSFVPEDIVVRAVVDGRFATD